MALDTKHFFQTRVDDHKIQPTKWVTSHTRFTNSEVADYALNLLKGMTLGNGIHNVSPKEAVSWACDAAELIYEELLNRDWVREIPPMDEMLGDGGKFGFK
jgi:hypothetical protein